ncbi:conserved hypothetical protein [metagenome]|uniref:Exopolyphosphatase n=1 Tax=metagenome TaxID=256318 RepID=A0A2P2BYU6_9ZZZZ
MIRIGNCSGFYGDRLSAMREMLTQGELDVLTGDYLAELTMLILGRDLVKDPSLGYARTFVRQLEDCLGTALERGVRIVSNAGGLNPAGLAARINEVATGLGLAPQVAHVEGDDLRSFGFPGALTANAYLGGFGIAAALSAGADVVVTGRVTDASLVVGAGISAFGWTSADHDQLAGAVVAGHILECGTQATGGNFSGFLGLDLSRPLGFPIAELAADGSSVITKHPGTGGAVTLDTVTAQLVYEIQSTRYLGPDVTTRLDTVELHQQGVDRVAVRGVRGLAPPTRLKVCVNELGGFRNSAEFVLTGLDVEAKADWVRSQLSGLPAAEVSWSGITPPLADAATEEAASVLLRCTVKDPSAEKVGRAFTGPVVELALASYPGFTLTGPPAAPTPYGIYRAEYVDRDAVTHTVVHADGRREVIAEPAEFSPDTPGNEGLRPSPYPAPTDQLTRGVPLGTFVHARSGDKGGDANLGLWVAHDGSTDSRYAERVTWLTKLITPARIRELVPEAADLEIEVFVLPGLGAVNVVLHGLLGDGVAASTRFDPQAKGLGEWVRSRIVHIQEGLL